MAERTLKELAQVQGVGNVAPVATDAVLAENAAGAPKWFDLSALNAILTFLGLSDTPSSYSGQAGKTVVVNGTGTGLEFTTPAGGGDMLKATYDPTNINANAFDRANHTGAQAISTVTGLQTALDAKLAITALASGTITARADDLNFSGGSDGHVLTVQADGSAAFEAAATLAGTTVTATPTAGAYVITTSVAIDDNVALLADQTVDIRIPQNTPAGIQLDITVVAASVQLSIQDWVNAADGYILFNGAQVGSVSLVNPGRAFAHVVSNPGSVPVIHVTGGVSGLQTAAVGPLDFNSQTISGGVFLVEASTDNTSRTLAIADAENRMIQCDNAAGQTFTIPLNATVAFPIGTVIGFLQLGAGTVTVAAAGGVTLEVPTGSTAVTGGENHVAFIRKRATDTWHIFGSLA